MAIQVIALLVAGIVMTLFAIDTSRLIGWSFYALLFSIGTLYQENKSSSQKIAKAIFLVNLLIPALYVGLNLGMFLPPGIYFQLWRLKNWILPF
jgi:predicted membrane protein